MNFAETFHYRTKAEIDASLPDLAGPAVWQVSKIAKVRTNNLKLIAQARDKFQIRLDTVWLAETYFQRFFAMYAFQRNTPLIFVAACIHLACKASDLPRPLEQVIVKTFKMRYANDAKEIGKIDDFMFMTEVKERVLLAERALLYCFGFDFRTEDPYSFALKYQTTYKLLDEDNSQRMLQWLSHAALFTTLCLQYPSSLLGVVAVWYAQHLVHGEIAVDEQGLEWWEKLPAERQDRVPVPLPTAAQIEDAHWQLVPHANWAAEKERLSKPGVKGCLPGDGCHCKVCSLHSDLMERAKQAAPQGQTSPQGASDASATTASGALPMDAPSLTSALKETRKDTGASAPRTGTVQASQAEAASPTGSKAAAAPATHGGDVLPVQPVAAQPGGNGSAASAHIGVHQNVPSSARSATSAAAAAAAAQKVDSAGQQHSSTSAMREGLQSQSQQRASPSWQSHQAQSGLRDGLMSRPSSTRSQDQSRQLPSQDTPQSQAYSPVVYPSHPSPSQHSYQQHQQPQQQPTGLSRLAVQQSAPAHAAAAPADDDSGPEEGEIEEGEVLPDGTVADSQAVDGSRNDVDMNGHASSHDEPTNGIRQHDRAEHQRDAGTAKQPRADASPRAGASGKKRNRSPTSYADPADDTHAHRDRPPSPQHGAVAADSNARKRQHSNSPKAPVAVERQ